MTDEKRNIKTIKQLKSVLMPINELVMLVENYRCLSLVEELKRYEQSKTKLKFTQPTFEQVVQIWIKHMYESSVQSYPVAIQCLRLLLRLQPDKKYCVQRLYDLYGCFHPGLIGINEENFHSVTMEHISTTDLYHAILSLDYQKIEQLLLFLPLNQILPPDYVIVLIELYATLDIPTKINWRCLKSLLECTTKMIDFSFAYFERFFKPPYKVNELLKFCIQDHIEQIHLEANTLPFLFQRLIHTPSTHHLGLKDIEAKILNSTSSLELQSFIQTNELRSQPNIDSLLQRINYNVSLMKKIEQSILHKNYKLASELLLELSTHDDCTHLLRVLFVNLRDNQLQHVVTRSEIEMCFLRIVCNMQRTKIIKELEQIQVTEQEVKSFISSKIHIWTDEEEYPVECDEYADFNKYCTLDQAYLDPILHTIQKEIHTMFSSDVLIDQVVNSIIVKFNEPQNILFEHCHYLVLYLLEQVIQFYTSNTHDLAELQKQAFKRLFEFFMETKMYVCNTQELETQMFKIIQLNKFNMWLIKFLCTYCIPIKDEHVEWAKTHHRSEAFISLLEKRKQLTPTNTPVLNASSTGSMDDEDGVSPIFTSNPSSCLFNDEEFEPKDEVDVQPTRTTGEPVKFEIKWKDGSITINIQKGHIQLTEEEDHLVLKCYLA